MPLNISTASPLPAATRDAAYSQTLVAASGTGPYSFSLDSGTLPPGMTLAASGLISNAHALGEGTYNFVAKVTDAVAATSTKAFAITVNPASHFASATQITEIESIIKSVLNASGTWGGAVADPRRFAEVVTKSRIYATMEVIKAIAGNLQHGYWGVLQSLVAVEHDAFLPFHNGKHGLPLISPHLIPAKQASGRWNFVSNPVEGETVDINGVTHTWRLPGVVLADGGSDEFDGIYTFRDYYEDKRFYILLGDPTPDEPYGTWLFEDDNFVAWDGSLWSICQYAYFSGDDVDSPTEANWQVLHGDAPAPSVTARTFSATEIEIGDTKAESLANFAAKLNASANGSVNVATYIQDQLAKAKVIGTYDVGGIVGNTFLMEDSSEGSITVSGATFTGGAEAEPMPYQAGYKADPDEIDSFRNDTLGLFSSVAHDAVDENDMPSELAMFWSIVNQQLKFTGYDCKIPMIQFIEADCATKTPVFAIPTIVKLAPLFNLKEGDNLVGIAQTLASAGMDDLRQIASGAMTVTPVSDIMPVQGEL